MNMVTILLIMIVMIIAAGIAVALALVIRSLNRSGNEDDGVSMTPKEREKHIDMLLDEFEEQMGETGGDLDDKDKKV